jgi:hypothetical protein
LCPSDLFPYNPIYSSLLAVNLLLKIFMSRPQRNNRLRLKTCFSKLKLKHILFLCLTFKKMWSD